MVDDVTNEFRRRICSTYGTCVDELLMIDDVDNEFLSFTLEFVLLMAGVLIKL